MFSQFSYPVICTDKYVQTINFYEDHFNYIPVHETSDFVVLQRENQDESFIAVLSDKSECVPQECINITKGLIISYPVNNVDAFYQQTYWEGLEIMSDIKIDEFDRKHFLVKDPNGNLINIAQSQISRKAKKKYEQSALLKESV